MTHYLIHIGNTLTTLFAKAGKLHQAIATIDGRETFVLILGGLKDGKYQNVWIGNHQDTDLYASFFGKVGAEVPAEDVRFADCTYMRAEIIRRGASVQKLEVDGQVLTHAEEAVPITA